MSRVAVSVLCGIRRRAGIFLPREQRGGGRTLSLSYASWVFPIWPRLLCAFAGSGRCFPTRTSTSCCRSGRRLSICASSRRIRKNRSVQPRYFFASSLESQRFCKGCTWVMVLGRGIGLYGYFHIYQCSAVVLDGLAADAVCLLALGDEVQRTAYGLRGYAKRLAYHLLLAVRQDNPWFICFSHHYSLVL